jgi:hypothetical protein
MAWICQECPDGTSCASTLAYFGCPFGHERLMHWEYEGGADPFDSCEWGAWRAVIDWIWTSSSWLLKSGQTSGGRLIGASLRSGKKRRVNPCSKTSGAKRESPISQGWPSLKWSSMRWLPKYTRAA